MTLNELIKTAAPMLPFGGKPGFTPQFGQWPPRGGFAPNAQTQLMPRTAQPQTAKTPMQPQEPPKTPQMQQYENAVRRGAGTSNAYTQLRQMAFSPKFNQGEYDKLVSESITKGYGGPEDWQKYTQSITDDIVAENQKATDVWNRGMALGDWFQQQMNKDQQDWLDARRAAEAEGRQHPVGPEQFRASREASKERARKALAAKAEKEGVPEQYREAWVNNLVNETNPQNPVPLPHSQVPAVWKPQPVATQIQGTQPAVTQQPANQGQNNQIISAWNMIAPNIPQGDQGAYSQAVDGLAQYFGMSPEQVHQAISSHIAGGGVTTTGQQGGANGTPPGAAPKTTGSGSTGKTNGSNGASRPTGQNIGMMDWAKQNPTLAAGIGALLVGALSLGIGGGGSKKDSSLGLILALLLGGGTFRGLKGRLSEKDVAGKTTQALDDANS